MGDVDTKSGRGRNVYGTDLVISYCSQRDIVLVRQITGKQGDGGRYTISRLLLGMGHKERDDVLLFVKNNNLHEAGHGLRGALVIINNVIGLVTKTKGTCILFQVLLPNRWRDSFHVIDLKRKDRYHGYFLQQVHGERPAVLQSEHFERIKQVGYPYMKGGYVYMDPAGPDFCIPSNNIPDDVRLKFDRLRDNLCIRNNTATSRNPNLPKSKETGSRNPNLQKSKETSSRNPNLEKSNETSSQVIPNRRKRRKSKTTSSRMRNLRKSKATLVVYVATSNTRLSTGMHANCFYIPVGATSGHIKCPWKSKDGSHRP